MNRIVRPARPVSCAYAVATAGRRQFWNGGIVLSQGLGDLQHSPLVQSATKIPTEFCQSYRINGLGRGSATCLNTGTGHEIRTDLPQKMGGQDAQPQPVELLLGALIGCTQATALYVGRNMKPRVLVDRLEFDINAFRDSRGALALPIVARPSIPAGIQIVEGTIKVHLKKGWMSADQLVILAEQTEARCPVASMMVAGGCELRIKWIHEDVE